MAGFIFDITIDSEEVLLQSLEKISHRGDKKHIQKLGKYFLGIVYSDRDYFHIQSDLYLEVLDGYFFEVDVAREWFKNKFFNAINGGWSGVLVDFRNNKLLVARDRWGESPVYVSDKDSISFASERKAFLPTKTNPTNTTLLSTRHYLEINYTNLDYNNVEYYKVPDYISNRETFEEASQTNLELSRNAIDDLLKSSSNIGVTIGGVDSSSVAYLLKERGIDFKMFSVSVGDSSSKKSDLYTARKLAEFLKHDLIEIILDEKEVFENLKLYTYICEEPSWLDVSVAGCFYELARRSREFNIKDMFTGMGIDILFGSGTIDEAFYYDPEKFVIKRVKDMAKIDKPPVALDLNKSLLYGGGIVEKTPFVDYRFVNHALSIPIEYRKVSSKNKATFRNAFRELLPDEIIYRPKITSNKGSNMDDSFKKLGKEFYNTMYREVFDNGIE